jgi:hypothetical protein
MMVQYEWFMIMEYCSLGTLWHAMRSGAFHHPLCGGRLQSRLSSPLLSEAEYASYLLEPDVANKTNYFKEQSSDRSDGDHAKVNSVKSQRRRGSAAAALLAVRDSVTSTSAQGLVEWDAWAVCKTLLETVSALQVGCRL